MGATQNNLKNISVKFPLGKFIAVTGVSGSGKSTLVNDILLKEVMLETNSRSKAVSGDHKEIKGLENVDKVINIDQSPIGRTPRSNPATYTGVFTDIRNLLAATPEAKVRGYNAGRFSFNVKVEDVRIVLVMVLRKLKCTFCQIFMCNVKLVMENGTIEKP